MLPTIRLRSARFVVLGVLAVSCTKAAPGPSGPVGMVIGERTAEIGNAEVLMEMGAETHGALIVFPAGAVEPPTKVTVRMSEGVNKAGAEPAGAVLQIATRPLTLVLPARMRQGLPPPPVGKRYRAIHADEGASEWMEMADARAVETLSGSDARDASADAISDSDGGADASLGVPDASDGPGRRRKHPRFEIDVTRPGLWAMALASGSGSDGGAFPCGAIVEFALPTPARRPYLITAGPDGALWFTETTGNAIGRITVTGEVSEFPLPTAASSPQGIVTGPDGALWFTQERGAIGRITTAGVITEYPIPNGAGTWPYGIVAGSDGNLWFTETFGSRIGRISPAGVLVEFRIPSGSVQPTFLTLGPDQNVWFVEHTGNRIGRITTDGTITEFPIASGGNPYGITHGPDGNLWYTAYFGNRIGRMTTAGVTTEFPVPAGGSPQDIVTGLDGNLWFTERAGNRIGTITPTGVITEVTPPTSGSVPWGIALGPDRALWFTASGSNKIGRIAPCMP